VPSSPEPLTIAVDEALSVSALLRTPPRARACYVLAHGAGAGMAHPFMAAVADELGERGIATLRYQFPYMEQGSKRPDAPKVRMRPFVPRWSKRVASCPRSLSLPAANPSAAA